MGTFLWEPVWDAYFAAVTSALAQTAKKHAKPTGRGGANGEAPKALAPSDPPVVDSSGSSNGAGIPVAAAAAGREGRGGENCAAAVAGKDAVISELSRQNKQLQDAIAAMLSQDAVLARKMKQIQVKGELALGRLAAREAELGLLGKG
jgi:hypothetical protein